MTKVDVQFGELRRKHARMHVEAVEQGDGPAMLGRFFFAGRQEGEDRIVCNALLTQWNNLVDGVDLLH